MPCRRHYPHFHVHGTLKVRLAADLQTCKPWDSKMFAGRSEVSNTEVGVQWASTVNSLNTWLHTQRYDQQITVWGAYDAETTWDGADKTRQFVDGFNANDTSKVPLVDFGDMRPGQPLRDPDTGR